MRKAIRFTEDYIITMRPYLLFVSGITGITGLALTTDLGFKNTLILSLAFFLSYGFGQALTDCFQIDTDTISSPYRPLVQGRISKTKVLIVSITGLVLIGVIVLNFNIFSFLLALLGAAGLATYTYFKRRWWAGPFYNAWIVGVLFIMAYLCGRQYDYEFVNLKVMSTLCLVFFGYANFVLTGYYKDISADRATGYNTFPVVFGLKVSSIISDIFALLAIAGWAFSFHLSGLLTAQTGITIPLLLGAAGIFASAAAQVLLHRVKDEKEAHKAISPVVHAYILLMSSIASAFRTEWGIPVLIFYGFYVLALKLRPSKLQI